MTSTEFAPAVSSPQQQSLSRVVVDDAKHVSPGENARNLDEWTLTSYDATSDSEYQLVLESSSALKMVATIPHSDYSGQNSPAYTEVRAASETSDKTFVAHTNGNMQTPGNRQPRLDTRSTTEAASHFLPPILSASSLLIIRQFTLS